MTAVREIIIGYYTLIALGIALIFYLSAMLINTYPPKRKTSS